MWSELMDPELFWGLPGPRSYVRELLDRLVRPTSVVLEAPRCGAPLDLQEAVREAAPHHWRMWYVDAAALPPEAALGPHDATTALIAATGVGPPDDPSIQSAPPPQQFEQTLRGGVLWVDLRRCVDPHVSQAVVALVALVERALKNRPTARPTFVLQVEGRLGNDWDPVLARHPWRGIVDRLDTLVYVALRAQMLRGMPAPHLDAGIVELAAYDLEFAELLLGRWDGHLDSAAELAAGLRQVRSWDDANTYLDHDGDSFGEATYVPWLAGLADEWPAGSVFVHSAVVPKDGAVSLRQRLLLGQMSSVFPAIERRKMAMARWAIREGALQAHLVPDPAEMEAKDLAHAMGRFAQSRYPAERDVCERLKRARDAVAHREVISPTVLSDLGL